uniref:Uncharacterized protein n=1 Tax=viral metagenome TaxID=1070528 RepID=A0A6C0CLE9_9ZZZZ
MDLDSGAITTTNTTTITPTGVFCSKSTNFVQVHLSLDVGEGCLDIEVNPKQTQQQKDEQLLRNISDYIYTIYGKDPKKLSDAYVKLLTQCGNLAFGPETERIVVRSGDTAGHHHPNDY